MIATTGFISFFAKKVLPLETVAKPPVAVIVAPKLPTTVPPRATERVVVKEPVLVKPAVMQTPDDLSTRCRILLNEAQREIDRLRGSVATPIALQVPHEKIECPSDSPASPPKERKTYAVEPVGKMPPPRENAPPRMVHEKVVVRPHVTNVGSLLDVLV